MGNIMKMIENIALQGLANGIVTFVAIGFAISFVYVLLLPDAKTEQQKLRAKKNTAITRVVIYLLTAIGLLCIARELTRFGIKTELDAINLCSVLFSVLIYYEGLQSLKEYKVLRKAYKELIEKEGKEAGSLRKVIRFLKLQRKLLVKNRFLLGTRLNDYFCYFDRGNRIEVSQSLQSLVRTIILPFTRMNKESDICRQLIKLEECFPQEFEGRALYIKTHDTIRKRLKKSKKVKVLEEVPIGKRRFIIEFLLVGKPKEAFKLRDKYVIVFMIIE